MTTEISRTETQPVCKLIKEIDLEINAGSTKYVVMCRQQDAGKITRYRRLINLLRLWQFQISENDINESEFNRRRN